MKRVSGLICLLLCLLAASGPGAPAQAMQSGVAEKTKTQPQGYPIAPDVYTTVQRTVVPDPPAPLEKIYPYEIRKFAKNGYGNWHYGPGLPVEKRLDIMAKDYAGDSVTNAAKLMNFFAITDIHLTDKESPNQSLSAGYKGGNSSAYSPVMLLTTQVLDAAIQTVNALHKINPFDFGISLGDDTNGGQYNELRWFIDILDGKNINPDSGDKDDPIPGPGNDYQDRFKAAGLDKAIPWFQTLGNHDHFWLGSYPVTDYFRKVYTGEKILLMGDLFTEGPDSRTTYMGSIDGRTQYGDIIGLGPKKNFKDHPRVHGSDPDRRSLTRQQWINEFFTTSSNPAGHGFSKSNVDDDFASYSFEPKSDIPLKVIVLDDTQVDKNYALHGQAYLDNERYGWLIRQLDQGQAEGKLMIIAAHLPLELIGYGAKYSPVEPVELVIKLQHYPNLIMWISGHRHRNAVTAWPSGDPTHPECGFWEVETSSLRDFPQGFRTFEVRRNSDNNVSIMAINVNPAVADGSLAALSRSYSIAAMQLFNQATIYPPAGVYNAELVKQLTPQMQGIIKNFGTPLQ